jgi:hypothetical protein
LRSCRRNDQPGSLYPGAIGPQQTTFREQVIAGNVTIDGDLQELIEFNSLFDTFVPRLPRCDPDASVV